MESGKLVLKEPQTVQEHDPLNSTSLEWTFKPQTFVRSGLLTFD